MFKKQVAALAACRMTIGINAPDFDLTINTQPVASFATWIHDDDTQAVMWPGMMKLSREFFETLLEHAVPLDPRALGALKHSPWRSISTRGSLTAFAGYGRPKV